MTRRAGAISPWWPALSGAAAGMLALTTAVGLTIGGWSPDSFAMALIVAGISLIAGVNAKVVAGALAPAARALAKEDEP